MCVCVCVQEAPLHEELHPSEPVCVLHAASRGCADQRHAALLRGPDHRLQHAALSGDFTHRKKHSKVQFPIQWGCFYEATIVIPESVVLQNSCFIPEMCRFPLQAARHRCSLRNSSSSFQKVFLCWSLAAFHQIFVHFLHFQRTVTISLFVQNFCFGSKWINWIKLRCILQDVFCCRNVSYLILHAWTHFSAFDSFRINVMKSYFFSPKLF